MKQLRNSLLLVACLCYQPLFANETFEIINYCDFEVHYAFQYDHEEVDSFQGDSTTITNTIGWFQVDARSSKKITLENKVKYFRLHAHGKPFNDSFSVGKPDVHAFCMNERNKFHYKTTFRPSGRDYAQDIHGCRQHLPNHSNEQGFDSTGFRKSSGGNYTSCAN